MSIISPKGDNLIFIISQPRSGSTLLQRILAGNPLVHTTSEPWLMLHPVYALRDGGHEAEFNAQLAYTATKDFIKTIQGGEERYYHALGQMASDLYSLACDQTGKTFFIDKTPRYYFILPELQKIFPEAKFIFLFRNPLGVLASILNTLVKEHWLLLARYRHDLLTAPDLLIDGLKMMGPSQAIHVNYEQLVKHPEIQTKRICEYIGFGYSDDMLVYGRHKFTTGHMGDSTKINDYTRPMTDNIDRWVRMGENEQTRHFAQEYMNFLGPKKFKEMGYDYGKIQQQFMSIPKTGGKISVTWDQLFKPDDRMQKRLHLSELAVLEHRRLVHYLRELIEKLTRKHL